MIDTDERPMRTLVTHYEIEQMYPDTEHWFHFDSAPTVNAAHRQIALYDDYAAKRVTRIVRVSTATERQVIG